ncbi:hypothetical protein SAMN02745885_02632 [Carboxydocella sporoproducens DSM 16521]|uniref:DUF4282 domain-containing protein n=2 Tax=Carboxydocella TaxID=178898 RepID=A0A1T4SE89_9FIRM|nr:hypothetical protein CFE_0557 [Carboxydocella thermautotrophica]GAW30651.1 hypothetical protein JDF658_04160 [Carboxydocella sp. JDF658]SKA26519.1 hypothetical protein SAMN02745885_02632 [Carboxydocella sporoproducens DSM 16521]
MAFKTLKSLLKKLFIFDEFMRMYLIMFSILYVIGIFKFIYLINSIIGFVQYVGLMIGLLIVIVLGLHFFQFLCRLVGMDKIYTNMKQIIMNRNKKN